MRLWSLHPGLLDRQGLLAVWREGLLARKVLAGETRAYRNHPQLERFRRHPDPRAALAAYLHALADEADLRGYRFDRRRIGCPHRTAQPLTVTFGQLHFEAGHLADKIRARTGVARIRFRTGMRFPTHPMFQAVPGGIAPWERTGRS